MLAITYPMKQKRIMVAKWGTPKKRKKKKEFLELQMQTIQPCNC
jgi:hypothetical protein